MGWIVVLAMVPLKSFTIDLWLCMDTNMIIRQCHMVVKLNDMTTRNLSGGGYCPAQRPYRLFLLGGGGGGGEN